MFVMPRWQKIMLVIGLFPLLFALPAQAQQLDLQWWASATSGLIEEKIAGGQIRVQDGDLAGHTALHMAVVANQDPAVISVLLKAGADIAAVTSSATTVLHRAAGFNPNPAIVLALIKAGAHLQQQDKVGWTALHYAAGGNQNPEVVMALLQAGADSSSRDIYGATPADYARLNPALQAADIQW